MAALGSLVVKLGLEYAQFTGGLDKSEQAALAASKKIQDTFDGMKRGIAATAGAVAGGLAAAFTVNAFTNLIQGSMQANAALEDLSMQTGASAAALKELVEIGKFNDMGPEQIGAAMNKLAANLAGATEESKGTGKALQALGIEFKTLKAMSPDVQMQTIATAMAKFEDGTGKSAVAMALFGKEGAKMIPMLTDLAEVEDLRTKLTEAQIEAQEKLSAQSANLDDNIVRISKSSEKWKKELAEGMIPALDLGAEAVLDLMNGSGGLREEVRKLSADGSIKQWTMDAIKGLSYVADAGQIAWRVLQSIGKGLGGFAAALVQAVNGDFRAAWGILKDSGQDMVDAFDGPTVGERFRVSLEKMSEASKNAGQEAQKASKGQIDFTNSTDQSAKTAAAAKDPFDALRDSILKTTAAYQAEEAAGGKLTEGQKKAIEALDQLRTGKVKVTEAQAIQLGQDIEALLVAEQSNAAREQFIKTADAERAARLKIVTAMEQSAVSAAEQNQALRDEIELIGLTEEQQTRVLQMRNEAIILTKEATLAELERASAITGTMTREQIALAAEIKALKERNELLGAKGVKNTAVEAAKKAEDEWKKTTDQINESLTDALMRGFESGKDFAKNMRDTVVNMFNTMVLRPVISAVLSPVSGAINGAVGSAVGSVGSSMLSSMGGSVIGNALGGVGAFGIGASYGATSLFANGLGATLSAGSSMIGAGSVMSGIGTIAGALGPIALGVGALSSIISSFDDSGTLHTGGAAQYSAATGLRTSLGFRDNEEGLPSYNPNDNIDNQFGTGFGYVERGDQTISAVSTLAQSLGTALDGVAVAFGQKAGYEVATAFADDTSNDGAWGALRISKEGQELLNWQNTRTSRWAPKEFGDGEEGYKQYLAAVAKDTRQVLLDMDLPGWADTVLQAIGDSPSIEDLSAALTQIGQAQTVFKSFGQYMSTFATLADSSVTKLAAASGGIGALAGNMSVFVDQFYTDAEKLAVNTENVREAMGKLGFELPATRDEFKALVQAQLALGDAGAETAAALLGLSGAFASIVPVTEAVTDSVQAMTQSLDDYISKTARSSTEADRIRGLQAVGNTAALKRLGVPGYASGGYHSGGLRLVGENGPELEVTGPANIISNPVTEQLLRGSGSANTARLEALVEKLTTEVANLRAETRAVVTHTATTARIIKRVTPDGDAIATREAAPV